MLKNITKYHKLFISIITINNQMKHCIIHYKSVESDSCLNTSLGLKARRACGIVEKVLNDESEVIIMINGSLDDITKHFNQGDSVTLYGCYLGMCLMNAYNLLSNKGVTVEYHSEGCI
jgi:hypothetical protein